METFYIALGMFTLFAPAATIAAIAYTLVSEYRADRREAAELASEASK